MKKVLLLLFCMGILTGCAGADSEINRGMALRTKLLQAQSCAFDADITADYGDKLYTFSMYCQADAQGDVSFTVTAPETIAGITGIISEEGGRLTFDDVALQFDTMADDLVTPVIGPWILIKTLRSGYLTSACMEDELLRLTIDDSYEEDALQLDIWLDGQDMPQRAEILHAGQRIVTLNVKNVVIS